MTARSTRPEAIALTAKRQDTTSKKSKNTRGTTPTEARKHLSTSNNAGAMLVDVNKELNEKQKLFVKYWAEGESISSASARAGYNDSATYAYRMTKMPNVLAMYSKIKAKYEEAGQMTRKKVMDMLLESYDMAKLMAEPSTMVAAAREVGKMCGYYAPVEHKMKVDVTGNIVVDRLNSMSDAELLKLITSGVNPALPNVPTSD